MRRALPLLAYRSNFGPLGAKDEVIGADFLLAAPDLLEEFCTQYSRLRRSQRGIIMVLNRSQSALSCYWRVRHND